MPQNRTPLRDQRFRIAVFAAPPLVALAVTVILFASGAFEGMSTGVFVLVLAVLVLLMAGAITMGLVLGDRAVGDRIELAFRAPGGTWRHARTDVGAGRLSLRRYWWQLRIPTGPTLQLDVRSVGSEERAPRAKMWWSLNPQLRIVDLSTEQGEYEIAALPSHLEELRARLRSSEEPAGR